MPVKLLHGDVEEHDVSIGDVAVPPGAGQAFAQLDNLVGGPILVPVGEEVVDLVLNVFGHLTAGEVHRGIHVAAAVGDAKDPVKMLHGVDELREVVAGAGDAVGAPASLHPREVLAGQTVVVPQVRPEIVPVAGVKEVEVRLADVDVVDGGVGVELLVPLRDERVLDARSVPLLDVVLAHELQDPEADVVAVAAAARQSAQRRAVQLSRRAVLGRRGRSSHALADDLLHVSHVLALVVTAGVPPELADRG